MATENSEAKRSKLDHESLKDGLVEQAKVYNQEHIFDHWNTSTEAEKEELLNSLRGVDFKVVAANFAKVNSEVSIEKEKLEALPSECSVYLEEALKADKDKWLKLGLQSIRKNQVAVVLLAGGQGTRLGSSDPKGMYDVGLPSAKSLFQIQAERICKLVNLAEEDCRIPLYIMTSPATDEKTRNFFIENKYFGLKSEDVMFFQQNTIPCLTFEGKILMQTKSKIARSPDGNGGLYKALLENGPLDDMSKRKTIKYVHAYCVDNVLVKVADPIFTGFCIDKGYDSGLKVVPKAYPEESVGIVCKKNGKYGVAEYSEITSEDANLVDSNGKLVFDAANICNHVFTLDVLKKICDTPLPYHVAKKKISTVDSNGNAFKPTSPNGIKLEQFIFDVLARIDSLGVIYCDRNTDFAPLKNAPGAKDSTPGYCREKMLNLSKKYLKEANLKVLDDVNYEISPLLSYQGEGLEKIDLQKYIPDKENNVYLQ